jgi:hypothetical protein
MLREALIVGSLAVLGGLAMAPSHALEWRHVPSVTTAAATDSNIRLHTMENRRTNQASVAASLDLAALDPGFSFRLSPQVVALRYADDAEADRNNLFTTFDLGLNDARQSWTFGGSYARESTLTSEFEGSGVLDFDIERTQRSLATGYSRALGPANSVGFSFSTTETGYADALSSPFGDYGYRTFQASHTRFMTERSSWRFVGSKSFIDSRPGRPETTSKAIQAVWTRQFSPVLQGDFGVGAFVVGGGGAERQDPSASLTFSVARQWPRWTLRAGGAREVRPELFGFLTREDAVSVEAQRRFRGNLSVAVSVRRARMASALANVFEFERDYAQAGATVSWRATQRLSVNAGLVDRKQDMPFAAPVSGRSGVVSVTFAGG